MSLEQIVVIILFVIGVAALLLTAIHLQSTSPTASILILILTARLVWEV